MITFYRAAKEQKKATKAAKKPPPATKVSLWVFLLITRIGFVINEIRLIYLVWLGLLGWFKIYKMLRWISAKFTFIFIFNRCVYLRFLWKINKNVFNSLFAILLKSFSFFTLNQKNMVNFFQHGCLLSKIHFVLRSQLVWTQLCLTNGWQLNCSCWILSFLGWLENFLFSHIF